MKKIISIVLVLIMILTGCTAKTEEPKKEAENNQSANEKTVIKLGMMSSSDVIPFVVMNEKKIADKYNLQLDLQVFTSAKDRDAAFQAGELDGVLTDYIGVAMYQNSKFDVKITGITDGDFLLMAGKNKGITDISQIKGKSIAISENTLIDYTFDYILKSNNMDPKIDVVKEIVPRIPDRLELLRNDKIDLGLMPEPFATLALKDGAVLLGSANEFGLYPAVSAFSQKALNEKKDAIRNLYKGYNEAVDYMNSTDIREYEKTIIEAVGYPEEMLGKIEIKPFRTSTLPPKEAIEEALVWARDKGLCSSELTYEQMVFDVYTNN
ncbi:MAG: lipoprotein [Bacillota bacterium]|jgi:NitT/TauT family transport system substrate-binding protein|nr:lipoprotein [Bacillota bacterium]